MKNYEAAVQALESNDSAIARKEKEIIDLSFDLAIRSAISNGNMEEYKELKAKADANKDAVNALCEDVYLLKIEKAILKDNVTAALFMDAYPIIVDICKKYQGKPYGEATRQKLYEEGRKHGFSFSFSGNYTGKERSRLCIHATDSTTNQVEVYASYSKDGTKESFVTEENKINVQNVTTKPYEKFVEDTKARALEIAEVIREYKEITRKASEVRARFTSILPTTGIKEPAIINEYNVHFG